MAKSKKNVEHVQEVEVEQTTQPQVASGNPQADLVSALIQALNATKPEVKKTVVTRKIGSPWHPKDGSPRLKLKRKTYQHGILLNDPQGLDRLTNEQIDLFNKIRPGVYCDGVVKVTRRRDRGIDITYPIRTASQRLRLVNQFGIRDLTDLLKRVYDEGENPANYKKSEVDEDF